MDGKIAIFPDGYGDKTSLVGEGCPLLLDYYEGQLQLIVWDDINAEDSSHVISLEGAREDRRRPEGKEIMGQTEMLELLFKGASKLDVFVNSLSNLNLAEAVTKHTGVPHWYLGSGDFTSYPRDLINRRVKLYNGLIVTVRSVNDYGILNVECEKSKFKVTVRASDVILLIDQQY